MKFIITIIGYMLISYSNLSLSQNSLEKSNDVTRIALASYIPESIGDLDATAKSSLKSKLERIITNNGLGSSAFNRFILTTNITELTKEISATTPVIYAYELELTFVIGDGVSGVKFASQSVTVKGAGNSKTKAYISAIRNIKDNDPSYQAFIDLGKKRILEYYNSQCDFILKSAQSSVAQNNFEDAIYQLTQVPDVCKTCYDKCMDAVAPIVQKQLDRDCALKLNQANSIWNSNMDVYTANQVNEILSTIDPQANCFKEVKLLSTKIEARVKELDNREWKMALKEQQDNIDIQKATIKAARDIGVAYGNNQPKTITTYNIRGWW